jgi:hypothetical protein
MMKSALEAYELGYADGLCMAEKMRWQGTPIGELLRGFNYCPDREHPDAYDDGFQAAMKDADRWEWSPRRIAG